MDDEEPIFISNILDNEVKKNAGSAQRRLFAFLIDLGIYYFLFFQIFFMIFGSMAGIPVQGTTETYVKYLLSNPDLYFKVLVGFFAGTLMSLFYFIISEMYLGASFGEKLLRLKVVSTDNSKINFRRLIIRNLTKTILLPFIIIDIIPVFMTKTKQRYTELISKTKVLYSKKLELIYEGYT